MATIYGSNTLSSGFTVANSCRFNIGSTDYLNRTSGTSTNTNAWSLSMWIKRAKLDGGTSQKVFSAGSGSTDRTEIYFYNDKLNIYRNISGSEINIDTSMLFRDLSAWYHTLWVWNGTAITLYVNGASVTLSATNLGTNKINGSSTVHRIGIQHDNSSQNFGGYLAEVVLLDGTAVSDATSFGEFDEDSPNIWKPIDVSDLTFGNNGFYLDFEDSSALGNDVSGNNNDFTVNNLTAVDQSTDTCSNNFCTLNPLNVPTSSGPTFSEGNLVSISTNANFGGSSTIGMTTGKWYCEAKCVTDSTIRNAIGITGETGELARDNNAPTASTSDQSSIGYLAENGNKYNPAAGDNGSSYGDSYANDDIIGIAMDLDNMKLYFSKNGTFQNSGDPTSGATGTGAIDITVAVADTIDGAYFVCQGSAGASTSRFDWNFGSPPYAVSSGNSDGKGHGNFEYSVPSGYLAWCTKNLGSDGG